MIKQVKWIVKWALQLNNEIIANSLVIKYASSSVLWINKFIEKNLIGTEKLLFWLQCFDFWHIGNMISCLLVWLSYF